MGLPELTFTLKKAAETVSTRISRGGVGAEPCRKKKNRKI